MVSSSAPNRWLGIELRHLAALDAVASTGSFAVAGQRLGYTQSAISQQIAALERVCDARLLDRPGGRRPVTPTEAGTLVLRHAHRIVSSLEAADADLTALAEGAAGTLRVGTFSSAGARILPGAMRRFLAEWPSIEVNLVEASYDDELLERVERGDIDVTFVLAPTTGPFDVVELLQDPHVLLVKADSPLASRGAPPRLHELAALPLIAYHRSTYGVEAFLQSRGIVPNVIFRSDESAIVQGLVGAGLGAALVPGLSVDLDDPGTVALELSPNVPPRIIGMAWHHDRYRSAAARAFVDVVSDYCRELSGSLEAKSDL